MQQEQTNIVEQIKTLEVTPDQWEKWRDARLAALQNDPQAFGANFEVENQRTAEVWQEKLARPDQYLGAVECNNAFVAIAGAYKSDSEKWNIISVYTAPEFRGKGLSKKVLIQVIDGLRSRGAKTISLAVNTQQHAAISLYEKLGFEIIGTEKDQPMGNGELHDEYVMEMAC